MFPIPVIGDCFQVFLISLVSLFVLVYALLFAIVLVKSCALYAVLVVGHSSSFHLSGLGF